VSRWNRLGAEHVVVKLSRKTLSEGQVLIVLLMLEYRLKFNKLRRVANSLIVRAICANGPAVWWVAVRVRADGVFASPGRRMRTVVSRWNFLAGQSPDRWMCICVSWWNSQDGEQKRHQQRVSRQPYWLCLGSRNSPGITRFYKLRWVYSHRLWRLIGKVVRAAEGNSANRPS